MLKKSLPAKKKCPKPSHGKKKLKIKKKKSSSLENKLEKTLVVTNVKDAELQKPKKKVRRTIKKIEPECEEIRMLRFKQALHNRLKQILCQNSRTLTPLCSCGLEPILNEVEHCVNCEYFQQTGRWLDRLAELVEELCNQ
eukprot:TRINITY_DN2111_c0_g1_i1.p1 TRINITY_DN2111_c0_g1~~TRINITY_DN2111_c0_g1_i1.p1  ORF type:complete len:140 (+),score=33.66 TRINITY_DN2111_c0_g1_i1:279-698(+)